MGRPIVVICGGVGAAKLLRGLVRLVPADELVAVVNIGDDMVMHGLSISPDLDTITYTLADAVSTERGWGLEGETWQAMEMLRRYGGEDWFALGDRDLGTHLYRTQRLSQGATLAEVTGEITAAWDLPLSLVPATNDRLATVVTTADHGEISFQEYFVKYQHSIPVTSVRFNGASTAVPAPGVLDAIKAASRIIIAPSNPVVSIDPVLAIPGVRESIRARRDSVVAVSPIVRGRALKGPADRLLRELGHESSATGIAHWYSPIAHRLIFDTTDAATASEVEAAGVEAMVTNTIMSNLEATMGLAKACLG